jgi:hypothetical protein
VTVVAALIPVARDVDQDAVADDFVIIKQISYLSDTGNCLRSGYLQK